MKIIKKIRNLVFKTIHPGNRFYCLQCDKSYSRFLSVGVKQEVLKRYKVSGAGRRKNAKCPNCGSVDRSRLLLLYFKLRTNILNKKTRILHIAPNIRVGEFLRSHESVDHVCGSLDPDDFKVLNAIKVDVTAIPFGAEEFDVVICNHILEHVPDEELALSEIYRVLKPKGFAILQVPIATLLEETLEDKSITTERERLITYGQHDHVRLNGLDYFDKIRQTGLNPIRDNPYDNNWLPDIEKHALSRIEDVIIGQK
jgi:SAM-dependent methyltransferase